MACDHQRFPPEGERIQTPSADVMPPQLSERNFSPWLHCIKDRVQFNPFKQPVAIARVKPAEPAELAVRGPARGERKNPSHLSDQPEGPFPFLAAPLFDAQRGRWKRGPGKSAGRGSGTVAGGRAATARLLQERLWDRFVLGLSFFRQVELLWIFKRVALSPESQGNNEATWRAAGRTMTGDYSATSRASMSPRGDRSLRRLAERVRFPSVQIERER
jgi:hypothetical protein